MYCLWGCPSWSQPAGVNRFQVVAGELKEIRSHYDRLGIATVLNFIASQPIIVIRALRNIAVARFFGAAGQEIAHLVHHHQPLLFQQL